MKHFGDITKLNGRYLPVVDVITGGSPCQDLSVAGKRAGLNGERSGLFMEQIRIIKEMRERDKEDGRTGIQIRPRYCVWENVPGAFSSNKGKDFQAVLTEFVKIAQPKAPDVPMPENGGGWPKAGCLYDEMGRWSIAWRTHDAQFWGVPQRRKRIALVADFGGTSAPEILFERESLSGHIESGKAQGKATAGSAGSGADSTSGAMNPWDPQSARVYPDNGVWHSLNANENGGQSRDAVFCLQGNGIDRADTAGCNGKGWTEDVSYTLNTIDRPAVAFSFDSLSSNSMKSKNPNSGCREVEVSKTLDCFDPNPSKNQGGIAVVQKVYDARGNGNGETVPTLTGDHQNRVTDYTALCVGNGQLNQMSMAEQANTLDTMHDQQAVLCFQNTGHTGHGWWNESDVGATLRTPCGGDSTKANLVAAVDCRNGTENAEVNGTLQAKSNGGTSLNLNNVCRQAYVVRRLTPLECERLQGFPDKWTDIGDWVDSQGKKHKAADSPRYKALGNSIALPFWQFLADGICSKYEHPVTMASLFDGIGGFPLVFERCGAKAVWASEIEEFPIAVTKKHFPELEA